MEMILHGCYSSAPVENLANLPSDIIRNVLRFGLLSIDNMRLISPLWNLLVDEHLKRRTQLPMIECARWSLYKDGTNILYMLIPMCYRRYFGAAKWTMTHTDFRDNSQGWFNCFSRNPAQVNPGSVLAPIFQRCSRVKKLEINKTTDIFVTQVEGIGGILSGDTIFEEVSVSKAEYLHPLDLDLILNAVRGGWVIIQRVVLSPSPHYYRRMEFEIFQAHNKFVLDVAASLCTIEMISTDVSSPHNLNLRKTKLSACFPMIVTLEVEPSMRFVLKAQ